MTLLFAGQFTTWFNESSLHEWAVPVLALQNLMAGTKSFEFLGISHHIDWVQRSFECI